MRKTTRLPAFCCCVLLACAAGTTWAGGDGWGVRFGLGDDPDQIVVGAQYDLGEVASNVHVEPNVELGFGDDVTVLAVAAIAQYRFRQVESFRPYAGGGVALGLVDRDRPRGDDTDFEIAIDVVGGLRWSLRSQREFFVELILGFGDLHDVQVMAGWRF